MSEDLFRVDTDEISSFTTKNQTELRKVLNRLYATLTAEAETFKYIAEEGTSEDSGTILSGNDVVATVAAVDSDLINSYASAFLGGNGNLIDAGIASAAVGGNGNSIEASFNSVIAGGSDNTVVNGSDSAVVLGASDSDISAGERVAIIASNNSSVTSVVDAAVIGGANCSVTAAQSVAIGDGATGHRQWALAVGGGKNVTGSLGQASLLAGTTTTPDNALRGVYTGNTEAIVMLPNSIIGVQLLVTATRVSDFASYYFSIAGVAIREGSADPVIVTQDIVSSGGDAALSTVTATLDVVGGGFGPRVAVTGLAATNIRWSVAAIITEQQFL